MPVARDAGQGPGRGDPVRRTQQRVRRGRARRRPALFAAEVPVFGICYGFQAMAQALGGEVARTGLSEFGRTSLKVGRAGRALRRAARRSCRCGCRTATRCPGLPTGYAVTAVTAGAPVAAFENAATAVRRGAVPSRGAAHRAGAADPRALPARPRRAAVGLDDRRDRGRAGGRDPRAGRRPPGDLRTVRRGRLGGRGGAGARGGRRPADLRLRRPRPAAQGRARAGRA